MNLRLVTSCGVVCALLFLAGCDQGRQDPPNVTVRVANVAPGFAQLGFRREQSSAIALDFKSAEERSYDVDTYDFFVDERSLLNNVAARTWPFTRELLVNQDYTFVLTEVGGEVVPVVLETPAAPATDSQITALHAAGGLPAMDLYLERPGVGIAGATPRGTFNVQESIAARTLPSGDYELWLTAAGDPANVLLTTATITLAAATTSTFIVVPEAGSGSARLSVLFIQDGPAVLYDRNVMSELRVINAATDTMPRDFAINSEFSPPLFSATPFADPTAYVPVALGVQSINVTPVGNPGVLELDQQVAPIAGQRTTVLFAGPAGVLLFALAVDDGRRIQNEAKLTFMNAATQFLAVDFVFTEPGGDPTGLFAVTTLGAPSVTITPSSIPPGAYDLYLRETATGALLSGATPLTLAGSGIYSVLAVNGPDTATASVALFDDFP